MILRSKLFDLTRQDIDQAKRVIRRAIVLLRLTDLELKVVLVLQVLDYDSARPSCTMLVSVFIKDWEDRISPAISTVEDEVRGDRFRGVLLRLRHSSRRLGDVFALGTQWRLHVRLAPASCVV